ncbi:major facilitator superfamily domain-containing protein [Mycena sp. CBHHK59/15]|nr:major facilitator superfamily domain-containing protein [Mycena sp. CBHHK59/15]
MVTGAFGYQSLPLAESGPKHGGSRILGPKWAHLPTLTVGLLGVQIFWSVEMSYASPYLLSLGLTKSNMAIVFLAGPLSGFLIQPLIGVLADNSTSRWGRRRPYMLAGCLLCVASMLLLGYTREFAAIFTGYNTPTNEFVTVWLAILSIYLIDFSINTVQAVDRALLVDTLPPSLQPAGNAWAALMLGMGSVVGFFVGNLDLPSFLPFFGSSELQVLSVIVSVVLLAGHITTAVLVKENVLVRMAGQHRPSFQAEIREIFTSMFTMPPVIRKICMIQFFAWLGWFPVLFYTTMYISDLYARSVHMATAGTPGEIAAEGTRLGARALFFSAILALLTNLILPLFISERARPVSAGRTPTGRHTRTASADSLSRQIGKHFIVPESFKVSLSTVWGWSHLLFVACMLGTFFTSSVEGATFLISLTGVSWAITQWAPFSLLGEAILTSSAGSSICARDEEDPLLSAYPHISVATSSTASLAEEDATKAVDLHGLDMSPYPSPAVTDDDTHSGNLSAKAGVILGIHNVFIVIPQFLVTILSAVVFAMFDPEANVIHGAAQDNDKEMNDKPNSVVYIFRLGAVWSLIAFTIAQRLAQDLRR